MSLALIVPIVVFGIALRLLYHWTGPLYPCIALHAFGNAIPLAGALDWTWQAPLLIVASTLAALTLTRLLALGLGEGIALHPKAESTARTSRACSCRDARLVCGSDGTRQQ